MPRRRTGRRSLTIHIQGGGDIRRCDTRADFRRLQPQRAAISADVAVAISYALFLGAQHAAAAEYTTLMGGRARFRFRRWATPLRESRCARRRPGRRAGAEKDIISRQQLRPPGLYMRSPGPGRIAYDTRRL